MIFIDILLCAGTPFLLLFGDYFADRIRARKEGQ